jgi:flagellar hook-associated protein 1 FlgK
MGLDASLSIASRSIQDIGQSLGIVSNNIANANTPDYATEVSNQASFTAGALELGARSTPATREIDLALQQAAFGQDSVVSGFNTTSTLLSPISDAMGIPGQGTDLPSLLGDVQNAFTTLLADPSAAASQSAVVNAAGNLTAGINQLSATYAQQRTAAESGILSDIGKANGDLGQIGQLSDQIIAAKVAGQSTANLENQRDRAVHDLNTILGVKTFVGGNGDMQVFTASGMGLPTRASSGPIQTSAVTLSAAVTYAGGGIPPITVNGTDITNQIGGGSLGAAIMARDTTIPTMQAELDEFSYQLSSRFAAQGLNLFSDPTGAVPAAGGAPVQAGYVGYASVIQVNPAVAASPAQVRDGNTLVTGSGSGASAFVPNPSGGPQGFSTLITRVLSYALGTDAQPGVPQPGAAVAGLGPDGTLSAPWPAAGSLADNVTALTAAQSATIAAASNGLTQAQTTQTTMNSALANASSVNVDAQMSQVLRLQNAYAANAKVMSVIQSLYTALDQAVQ